MLIGVGLAVTELVARGREHHEAAAEISDCLTKLHSLARMVAEGDDAEAVVAWTEREIATLLDLKLCRYDPGPATGRSATISQSGDIELAGRTWSTLPGRRVEIPVCFQGRRYGKFVLVPTPGSVVPTARRLVAVALADEVGAMLADLGT